jgi:hypothetical protein
MTADLGTHPDSLASLVTVAETVYGRFHFHVRGRGSDGAFGCQGRSMPRAVLYETWVWLLKIVHRPRYKLRRASWHEDRPIGLVTNNRICSLENA